MRRRRWAAAAILTRTPLVMMEQNTRPGVVNRTLWRFANKVCVGFNDSAAYFTAEKVEMTGNPTRFSYQPTEPTEPTVNYKSLF